MLVRGYNALTDTIPIFRRSSQGIATFQITVLSIHSWEWFESEPPCETIYRIWEEFENSLVGDFVDGVYQIDIRGYCHSVKYLESKSEKG